MKHKDDYEIRDNKLLTKVNYHRIHGEVKGLKSLLASKLAN